MDVNILFMVLTTLIPDIQGSELTQDGAYLISGMREGVKTVKIQHVSVACTGHVGHVRHVRSGALVTDSDPVPSQGLAPVNLLMILITVEPQLMLD